MVGPNTTYLVSCVEAQYIGVANVASKSCCLHNLLFELYCPITKVTLVNCDNINVVYLSDNSVQHRHQPCFFLPIITFPSYSYDTANISILECLSSRVFHRGPYTSALSSNQLLLAWFLVFL